jgi:hypothetical protein
MLHVFLFVLLRNIFFHLEVILSGGGWVIKTGGAFEAHHITGVLQGSGGDANSRHFQRGMIAPRSQPLPSLNFLARLRL